MEASNKAVPTRRERTRTIAAFTLGGLAVLFAVVNLDDVEVQWIVATWTTPLIVVIAVSVLVGALMGWMLGRRRER